MAADDPDVHKSSAAMISTIYDKHIFVLRYDWKW